jgi:hypothetical protein
MIKLFTLKQKKDGGEQNRNPQKRSSAACLRITKGEHITHYRLNRHLVFILYFFYNN